MAENMGVARNLLEFHPRNLLLMILLQMILTISYMDNTHTDMSTAPPPPMVHFLGGGVQLSLSTTQTCLLHKNVIYLKMRKFSGGLL